MLLNSDGLGAAFNNGDCREGLDGGDLKDGDGIFRGLLEADWLNGLPPDVQQKARTALALAHQTGRAYGSSAGGVVVDPVLKPDRFEKATRSRFGFDSSAALGGSDSTRGQYSN